MTINIEKHIEKSIQRLTSDFYSVDKVLQKKEYGWQGDYEGRVLLALCNLVEISGKDITRVHELFDALPSNFNEFGFLGNNVNEDAIDEQQLSGHSWLLRGLTEYYLLFKDEKALQYAHKIVYNLFLKVKSYYSNYPIKRKHLDNGGVSGESTIKVNNWILSTDIGCAFICIDGLSAYYEITKDIKVRDMLEILINKFCEIDLIEQRVQTHATLTALRGILRFYYCSNNEKYLNMVKKYFDLYLNFGMTLTFSNYNWFSRKDTWTEPCAVVDSLIIAISLYKITNDEKFRTLARRICFNGLTHVHRENGGAGPDSCVTNENHILRIAMYEASFCCTMRYCEGLKYIFYNRELFIEESKIDKLNDGRVLVGDVLKVKELSTNKEMLLSETEFPSETSGDYLVIF